MEGTGVAAHWAVGVTIFALGIAAGFLTAWLALPHRRRVRQLEQVLEEAREEHARYRGQVNQHFQKTAELFEDMTDRYRAIYQHLAAGAQALCEERPQSLQLDFLGRSTLPVNKSAAPPPGDDGIDEPVRRKVQPGDGIDESYLGDAPYVPELDEVVESLSQQPHNQDRKSDS